MLTVETFERCGRCGRGLVGVFTREFVDELLCEQCYEKAMHSPRWILTSVVTDGTLLVAALIALFLAWMIPIPVMGIWGMLLKIIVYASMLAAIYMARPHVLMTVKDIFMKRKGG